MRKSRVVGLTALAAVTALVISACSGTPGQAGGSTTAAPACLPKLLFRMLRPGARPAGSDYERTHAEPARSQ